MLQDFDAVTDLLTLYTCPLLHGVVLGHCLCFQDGRVSWKHFYKHCLDFAYPPYEFDLLLTQLSHRDTSGGNSVWLLLSSSDYYDEVNIVLFTIATSIMLLVPTYGSSRVVLKYCCSIHGRIVFLLNHVLRLRPLHKARYNLPATYHPLLHLPYTPLVSKTSKQ